MLPAVLARLIIAALRKYAPRAVGAGLAALGIIEAADLAREAWATFFGDKAEEVAAGAAEPESAPPELVRFLSSHTEMKTGSDLIEEEEVLRELDRATRRDPAADFAIQILGGTECSS